MERLVTQEKQRKIKEAKFLRKEGRMSSTARVNKGYFLHSKTEVGTGEVSRWWELFRKKGYIK